VEGYPGTEVGTGAAARSQRRKRKEEEKPTKTFLQKGFSRKQENWQ